MHPRLMSFGFTVHEANIQLVAIEVYKFKNGISPEFMNDIFTEKEKFVFTL